MFCHEHGLVSDEMLQQTGRVSEMVEDGVQSRKEANPDPLHPLEKGAKVNRREILPNVNMTPERLLRTNFKC